MKNSISGWKDVFSFTLSQVLKTKAYLISYFLLVTLVLISMPLASSLLLNNTEDENAPSPVNKVYVDNNTSLPEIDFEAVKRIPSFKHIEFETMSEDYVSLVQRITEEESSWVILKISDENGTYNLHLSMAKEGAIKRSQLQKLGNAISSDFTNTRMTSLGISDEQLQLLQTPVVSKVTMTDITGDAILEEDTSISFSEYWFVYGILFFVLMANMMTGTQVATSIATEKSTKVVEYLLITVRPLALMIGKVFAMMAAALIQMLSMVAAMFISNIVSSNLSSDGDSLLSQLLPRDLFQNINILNLALCLLLVFLGMAFYAVLAGLAGATVSRLEELNEGLTLFTMASIIGVYIGLGAANSLMGTGLNAFAIFAFLFPLSSPFVLPGAILIGKASMPIIGIAIVFEVLFMILLLRFVAKVYETLILHNGNTIKLKQLFQLSKHSS